MYYLTHHQSQLVKAASKIQMQSLVTLHSEGHPIFEDFLKEFDEVEASDISMELLEGVISIEELEVEPEKIWEMNKHHLLAIQFIVLKMLPEYDWPIAKKALYQKLQKRIDLLSIKNPN